MRASVVSRVLLVAGGCALLLGVGFGLSRATTSQTKATMRVVTRPAIKAVTHVPEFSHTVSGSEGAAAHKLLELERAMDSLSPQRTSRVAEADATAAEASAMDRHASAVIQSERTGGVPIRRVAIATNPTRYRADSAVITVLEEWIYASPGREAVWAVERVALVWRSRGWLISGITGAATSDDESLAVLRRQLEFSGVGDATVR